MIYSLAALVAGLLAVSPCAAQSDSDFFRQLIDGARAAHSGARAARDAAQAAPKFQKVDFVKPQASPALEQLQREQQAIRAAVEPATMIVRIATNGGSGTGTAVFVDPSGLALTNAHVADEASNGMVEVYIGPLLVKRQAKVLASAPGRDIAILQVIQEGGAKADWPALRFGDQPKAGAIVFAIGNPIDQGFTFTKGDVGQSANSVTSPWLDPIQLSLQLNPGNSGGPLVDISYKLAGLNTSILQTSVRANTGISFAIPASALAGALAEFKQTGKLVDTVTGVAAFGPGMIIMRVKPGSEADKAGFKVGDAVASFAGSDQIRPDQKSTALYRLIGHSRVGQNVPVTVVRGVDVVLQTAEPKAAKPKASLTLRFNPAIGLAVIVPTDLKSAAAWLAFYAAVTKTSEEKLLINGKLYETEAMDVDEDGGFFKAKGWTPSGAAVQTTIPVEELKREAPKK